MARNRGRNQSGAIRFVPALKAFMLCLLLGGTAVGYVAQKNKIYELGRQITAREERLRQLKKHNEMRASYLANMQLPQTIAERVKELHLGLYPPQPGQVVWLAEPAPATPTNAAPPVLVARQNQ